MLKKIEFVAVMISVVKCVSITRTIGLNRREYCGLSNMQYGNVILHCEVHRLSRGQVL